MLLWKAGCQLCAQPPILGKPTHTQAAGPAHSLMRLRQASCPSCTCIICGFRVHLIIVSLHPCLLVVPWACWPGGVPNLWPVFPFHLLVFVGAGAVWARGFVLSCVQGRGHTVLYQHSAGSASSSLPAFHSLPAPVAALILLHSAFNCNLNCIVQKLSQVFIIILSIGIHDDDHHQSSAKGKPPETLRAPGSRGEGAPCRSTSVPKYIPPHAQIFFTTCQHDALHWWRNGPMKLPTPPCLCSLLHSLIIAA